MALTRKSLKAMGLTDEQVDSIIEMHTETVNGLKDALETAQSGAKELPALQKKVEQLESDLEAAKKDGWKEKHDTVKKEFDEYKAEQARKETRAAKEKAVRAYLEGKNVRDGNLTIAMRSLRTEIEAAELDGDKLKDTKPFDELLSGELSGLVTTTIERGAPPPKNPPINTGGTMSKEQIMSIPDRASRRAAIAANMDAFTK